MEKNRMIFTAAGADKPDLVLKNGSYINVFTETVEKGDIAITDGYIVGIGEYEGIQETDISGTIVSPGFIDGHIHFESALVAPTEYEKAALSSGTVAVVADPHEIANVAGTQGLDFMLDAAEHMTMRAYFAIPSCVPSCPFEESGSVLEAKDLRPYYKKDQVLGLAEVMNSPGVVSGDKKLMRKIYDAEKAGKNIDGHAPGLSGKELCAYISAGIRSDHECTTPEEAMEKLRLGQWIMIREGTAAQNLEALLPLCGAPYYQHCMFVTDDRHPSELIAGGYMDAIIRKAASLGVPPVRAIKMCTYNTAVYFGMKNAGAVAPGYKADLAVISDIDSISVKRVYVGGSEVYSAGREPELMTGNTGYRIEDTKDRFPAVWNSFNMPEVRPEQFEIKELKTYLRVISLNPHQLLTDEQIITINPRQRARGGVDISNDIVKCAVFERHNNTGHVGIGFLKGYSMKAGAVAASVAHDAHNLIVAGTNNEDMALAASRLRELSGGLIVVFGGNVLAELPLPIGGIMSPLSVDEINGLLAGLKKAARTLGVSENIDPFMTLSFVSLPVIPKLRLNGRGLIDVGKNCLVDVTF